MNMLITERTILNPHKNTRVRSLPPVVALPEPLVKPRLARVTKTHGLLQSLSLLGDRQSWLLLALVLIPVCGAIYNFITYGFNR